MRRILRLNWGPFLTSLFGRRVKHVALHEPIERSYMPIDLSTEPPFVS